MPSGRKKRRVIVGIEGCGESIYRGRETLIRVPAEEGDAESGSDGTEGDYFGVVSGVSPVVGGREVRMQYSVKTPPLDVEARVVVEFLSGPLVRRRKSQKFLIPNREGVEVFFVRREGE